MQNEEYNKKWIAAFATSLSREQKEKLGIGQGDGFLWHAFSFGLVPCLKGDEARAAYDMVDKIGAIQAFYEVQNDNQYTIVDDGQLTQDYFSSKQLDVSEKIEVYIIGDNYKWCYIRTHEEFFGPYFCYAEQK